MKLVDGATPMEQRRKKIDAIVDLKRFLKLREERDRLLKLLTEINRRIDKEHLELSNALDNMLELFF